MGRFIKITLDDKARAALEEGYRRDKSHTSRQRCQIILLKAQGRKSKEIAAMFERTPSQQCKTMLHLHGEVEVIGFPVHNFIVSTSETSALRLGSSSQL
jgi:hypothetical protein